MNVFGPAVVVLASLAVATGFAQESGDRTRDSGGGDPLVTEAAAAVGAAEAAEAAESVEAAESAEPRESAAAAADRPGEVLESCFNTDGMIDISVLDDAHLYVRTRGNNSYLVRTELCEGLERSYLRRTARLVPFGREVCASDGSHVVYATGGQDRVCPVRGVVLVADRAQAREIAAGNDPIVIFEELPTE